MAEISTKKRTALPGDAFADPANRAYPIHDKANADNAMARLEQQKSSMSPSKYSGIKSKIRAAQRRFGEKPKAKGLHIRADLATGGSLHVRHMFDGGETTVLHAGEAVALSDVGNDSAPVWNEVAIKGSWRGHPQGPFVIDDKVLSDIVRNFNATANKDVPIDYEHASEQDPTQGSIPVTGAPACAHIRQLELRAGGRLWGLFDYGDQARGQVRRKEYRFFSPAIRFNAKDRVTGQLIGAVLSSGALTNKPFLDGMQPLAASEAGLVTLASPLAHAPHEYMPSVRRALKLHDLATARECSDHLGKLRDHFDSAGQDPGGSHEGVQLADYCMSLRNLAGATPGATWDDVFDAIQDLIDAAMDEHEIEYHAGEEASLADDSTDGDTTMSDADKALLLTAQTEATTAKGQVAELTLRLTTAETTIASEKARADAAEKLLSEQRAAADDAEIDTVLATHGKAKGYTVEHKPILLSFLQSNPEGFRKLHPKAEGAATAQLFTTATPPERRPDPTALLAELNGETVGMTINRLMKPKSAGGEGLTYSMAATRANAMHGSPTR